MRDSRALPAPLRWLPRSLASLAAAALAATFLLAAPSATANEPLKVGFVYVGPISDHGWTYRHDVGRRAVAAAFPGRVETSYVESVAYGADAERVIARLAAEGHGLVFTTSFGFMNPTIEAAARHHDTRFEHATGYKRADNVSTYAARFYEGRYVSGVIAGHLSETNTVGYVGSFPIPEVVRGINAFLLGARSVNPDIRVRVIWVNTWYDPGKERDAALALIDQGADILAQHTDSPAPLQAAGEAGIYAFGQASDMHDFAPDTHLTAIVDNWDAYYIARTRAVLEGTWESGDTWGGLDSGMVEMARYEKHARSGEGGGDARRRGGALRGDQDLHRALGLARRRNKGRLRPSAGRRSAALHGLVLGRRGRRAAEELKAYGLRLTV